MKATLRSVGAVVVGLLLVAPITSALAAPATGLPATPGTSESTFEEYEDWKWPLSSHEWTAAMLPGLGVINSSAGFTFQGALAKRVVRQGFAPDISNQVFIEVQGGPYVTSGASAFLFSTHLRWDFMLNDDWTFYALGGLGGNATSERLGNQFQLLPRFGVGAVLDLQKQTGMPIGLRGELSRELMSVGAQFRI